MPSTVPEFCLRQLNFAKNRTVSFARILPKFRQLCQNSANFAKIPPTVSKIPPTVPKFSQLCQNSADFAKIPPTLPKFRRLCQNSVNIVKIPPTLSKSRQLRQNLIPQLYQNLINDANFAKTRRERTSGALSSFLYRAEGGTPPGPPPIIAYGCRGTLARILAQVGARLGRIFFKEVLEQFSFSGGWGHPLRISTDHCVVAERLCAS